MLGDLFELTESLTSIFSILQMRNLVPVDAEAAFTPWRNANCKLMGADGRHELLDGSTFANR
jgi:hypothetical protein